MNTKQVKSPTSCYCLKTRRVASDVSNFYDHILAPSGVTVRQYSVLLNISRSEKGSISELAEMAELDRSTLSRNLKPLFQKELIRDVRSSGARDCKLELTDAGSHTLKLAMELWQKAQLAVEQKLGKDGLEKFDQLLEALEAL